MKVRFIDAGWQIVVVTDKLVEKIDKREFVASNPYGSVVRFTGTDLGINEVRFKDVLYPTLPDIASLVSELNKWAKDISDRHKNADKATALTIGGVAQNLSANRTWLWTPGKYHIEAGESVTVPEKYQQLISTPFINDGEVIIEGKLIEV